MRYYSPVTKNKILKLVSGVEISATFDENFSKGVKLLGDQNIFSDRIISERQSPNVIIDSIDENALPLQGKSIAIVGAGIAGLAAAYELQKLGAEIIIYEADKERIGGRIYTFRKNGLHGEFGAMRIPKNHEYTWKYIHLFEIPTRKFIYSDKSEKVSVNLKNIQAHRLLKEEAEYEREPQKRADIDNIKQIQQKYNLTIQDFEIAQSYISDILIYEKIWLKVIEEPLKKIKEKLGKQIPAPERILEAIAPFDSISLEQRFEEIGFSTGAKNYTAEMMGLSSYLDTSFAEHLLEEFSEVWLHDFVELNEGMDSLVEKFVGKIGRDKIKLGSRVTKLENSERALLEYIDESGNDYTKIHDWIICTLPLKILKELNIKTAFPSKQIEAINNLSYHSSSKIISYVKNRFWEKKEDIFGGGSITDHCSESTWYPSDNHEAKDSSISEKSSLLLTSYSWGKNAQKVDETVKKDLDRLSRETLEKYHDKLDVEQNLEASFHWSWDHHNKGAFAFCSPMDYTKYHLNLIKKNGRILLAGEHCSFTHSWIQGALESIPPVLMHILYHELINHKS